MLSNLGWSEALLLAVAGLLIFGPDRLPRAIRDLSKMLRELRTMARGAASDLRTELGPEMADIDLRSLHPRRFVEDALFGDDDDVSATASDEPAKPVPAALAANERPPYDSDAT
ncbi:MAG: twin-arginine translocase TatA/TatE family subunit [Frankiaceae bacterium]|nr:twin-arginine translocase TatA/TatE family subunit [Frankiaceae bacterium]MBV9870152.1 twin-arginine translocase TatA/TatE family subunit [Frankiaceae bacterium]